MSPVASRPVRVGVLSQDAFNPYVAPLLHGLSLAARERGIRLVLFVEGMTPDDLSNGRRLTTSLAGPASLDAILLLPLGYTLNAHDLAAYCARFAPLPICTIPDVAGNFCSRVSVDNEAGLRAGLRHLFDLHGYRRVAFVRGPRTSDEAELRFRVYREELARAGLPFAEELVAEGAYLVQDGAPAVAQFLEQPGPRVEAIVCANDGMALGALEELTRRGIVVPDEIALLGFDDIELARYVDPPLSTVRQPLRELASRALDVLLERLSPGAIPRHEILESELVIRESCGCSAYRTSGVVSSTPGAPNATGDALEAYEARAFLELNNIGLSELDQPRWKEELYASFLDELSGADGVFLPTLGQRLEEMAHSGGDIAAFHKLITRFWKLARRRWQPASLEWRRADTLLHAARVKISGSAERAPAREQVRFEEAAHKLTRTSTALSSVVDPQSLSAVLAHHLPEHSIDACYVCLYETGPEAEGWTRLVTGFEGREPFSLPPGGLRFPTTSVLPDGALGKNPACWYMVGPLTRGGDAAGYVVFQCGDSLGFIFENLLTHLGSVERRIDLLQALLREASLREAAERARMEKELAIAARIQMSILPPPLEIADLQVAAAMRPATEVGGDYYDVIPTTGGAYLGIGDVAGHGLPTGLVVLMLQSAISALVRAMPEGTPSSILTIANSLLYENIRDRMRQSEFITFTLARYQSGGRLTLAGAHEDILVLRARTGRVEIFPTNGIWLAGVRNAAGKLPDSTLDLDVGDVLLLYTDGVTEARSPSGERFGVDRLVAALVRHAGVSVQALRDAVLHEVATFAPTQEDDVTLMVVRRAA